MTKIITDTSSLFSKQEAKEWNVTLNPLHVSLQGQDYCDYLDISTDDFSARVRKGETPRSSQPSIGEVAECFSQTDDSLINITIADGLSGTYQTALQARELCANKEKIFVFNSRTICGPHRYLVSLAARLAHQKKEAEEILSRMEGCLQECGSFLIPVDFDFLRRGGRLTPLAAKLGGLLKIRPVMQQSKDGRRLDRFHVGKTMREAIRSVASELAKRKVDLRHRIYIAHDCDIKLAEQAAAVIKEKLGEADIVFLKLSPAFITQGGPGCLAIQYILKDALDHQ